VLLLAVGLPLMLLLVGLITLCVCCLKHRKTSPKVKAVIA